MIIENAMAKHGYAELIVADYHLEYPLPEHNHYPLVGLVWNNYEIGEIHKALTGNWDYASDFDAQLMEQAFPGLMNKYPLHFDYNMNLWHIRGNPEQIFKHLTEWFEEVYEGPRGADDDTFDYWPNAYDMATMIVMDLDEIAGGDVYRTYHNNHTQKLDRLGIPEWEPAILTTT